MFALVISCLTASSLSWFMDLTFQVPMQYFCIQHQTFLASITSHIHNWVLFLLWLHPFILFFFFFRYNICLLFICDLRYNKLHIFKACDLISLIICVYLWHCHHSQGNESFHHPPEVLLPYASHPCLYHGPQKVSCLLLQVTLHDLDILLYHWFSVWSIFFVVFLSPFFLTFWLF